MRNVLRSKIHKANVTECDLNYEGSITIDKKLLKAADIIVGEKVQVINISNALRFETYAIEGWDGEVCLNGGAARLATPRDKIIVITYGIYNDSEKNNYKSKVILVNDNNTIKKGW